jgi:hypothetical protein
VVRGQGTKGRCGRSVWDGSVVFGGHAAKWLVSGAATEYKGQRRCCRSAVATRPRPLAPECVPPPVTHPGPSAPSRFSRPRPFVSPRPSRTARASTRPCDNWPQGRSVRGGVKVRARREKDRGNTKGHEVEQGNKAGAAMGMMMQAEARISGPMAMHARHPQLYRPCQALTGRGALLRALP